MHLIAQHPYRRDDARLSLVLEGAQFAPAQAIVIKEDFSEIRFQLEGEGRTALISVGFLPEGDYAIKRGEKEVARFHATPFRETSVELQVDGEVESSVFSIYRSRQRAEVFPQRLGKDKD